MEKMLAFPERVADLGGLYIELKKSAFAVRNVGADERGTYVFLEPDEEKDPAEIVRAWIGKPAPDPTDRAAFEERKKAAEAVLAEPPTPAFEPPSEPEKKPGIMKRFLKKLF